VSQLAPKRLHAREDEEEPEADQAGPDHGPKGAAPRLRDLPPELEDQGREQAENPGDRAKHEDL
jgi:hypothetical protein